ncbi:MAG: hypothetical protein NTV80_04160 [Verrucomicrobia bacterium]|nr:hypothetical protein [Verrucomicrobiota bacterium]
MTQRFSSWMLWVILVITLLMLAAALLAGLGSYYGWRRYADTPEDHRELRLMIYRCHPLLSALAQYRSEKGATPVNLKELKLPYVHYREDVIALGSDHPIYYHSDSGTHFNLYVKMGWDAGLQYDSADEQWAYDPGDGSQGFDVTP